MPKRAYWLLFILCFCLPESGWAVKKLGQTGFKWLSIPTGARAAGMGNAFTPMDSEMTAAFWNPAGINGIDGPGLTFTSTSWIAGISHSALSGVWDLKDSGVLGISLINLDYGNLKSTIRADNDQGFIDMGTFSPEAMMVGVTYGRRISSRFTFGVNYKYCYEDLGSGYISFDSDTSGVAKINNDLVVSAFDFGTLFYPGFHDLRFGMTLQNFSQEKEYIDESFPLPLTFRFGTAMNLFHLFGIPQYQSLTFAVDLIHSRDYTERIHYGIEYSWLDLLSFRAGYKQNYDEEDLSLGLGTAQSIGPVHLQVDYAYNNFRHFDPVHIFTIGFSQARSK